MSEARQQRLADFVSWVRMHFGNFFGSDQMLLGHPTVRRVKNA